MKIFANNVLKKSLIRLLACALSLLFFLPVLAQEEEWHYTQNWFRTGYYDEPENVHPAPVPQSLTEAVQMLPPLPTVEQLMSPIAKSRVCAATYAPYTLAVEQAMTQYIDANIVIQRRINAARIKQAQREQRALEQDKLNIKATLMPSSQEMMQMVMAGEIDPDWPEDKIMNVVAGKMSVRWDISKQEYLKLIKMAQKDEKQARDYVEANYPEIFERAKELNAYDESLNRPDPREERFAEIAAALDDMEQEFNEAVIAYIGNGAGGYASHTHSPAYDQLLSQLRQDWYTCQEAKQVEAIEDALDIRIEKWITMLTDNKRNEIPFPLWWETERRKENVMIDQWNRRCAEQWLNVAREGERHVKGAFEKLVALETENERLAQQGDSEHVVYLTNKLRLNNYMAQLYRLTEPYQDALWFPCIEHVATSGVAQL